MGARARPALSEVLVTAAKYAIHLRRLLHDLNLPSDRVKTNLFKLPKIILLLFHRELLEFVLYEKPSITKFV